MNPADLERRVGEALKALPSPRAPGTLLPRVMGAVAERMTRPWYARPWMTWPRAWQAVSVAAVALVGGATAAVWPSALAFTRQTVDGLALGVVSVVVGGSADATALMSATRVLLREVVGPAMSPVAVFVLLMYATCLACGAALRHVAFREASHP